MFDSACPSGWTEVTDFQQRFPRGHDADGVYCEVRSPSCYVWFCITRRQTWGGSCGCYVNEYFCGRTNPCKETTWGQETTCTTCLGYYLCPYFCYDNGGWWFWRYCTGGVCYKSNRCIYQVTRREITYDGPAYREVVFCKKD